MFSKELTLIPVDLEHHDDWCALLKCSSMRVSVVNIRWSVDGWYPQVQGLAVGMCTLVMNNYVYQLGRNGQLFQMMICYSPMIHLVLFISDSAGIDDGSVLGLVWSWLGAE